MHTEPAAESDNQIPAIVDELLEQKADFYLYALDPGGGPFYDTTVLGKTRITRRSVQLALINALKGELSEHAEHDRACGFDPHHGIRLKSAEGVVVDLIICVRCGDIII